MKNKKKDITELFVKNIIAKYFVPDLKNAIKNERPDFITKNIGLEVTTLIEENVAKPHSLFEKYKGLSINDIPDSVFKACECYKASLTPIDYGGYGIRNVNGELKFIFDAKKIFIGYIHNELSISNYLKMIKEALAIKHQKLNQGYQNKSTNHLGIFVPTTFMDSKVVKTIGIIQKDWLSKEWFDKEKTHFDNVYVVFYDTIIENRIKSGSHTIIRINEENYKTIIKESEAEYNNNMRHLSAAHHN